MILSALAIWRITSLIVREDGPGDIFARIRAAAGVYREGEMSNLAKGITCPWCVSMWVAIVFVVLELAIPKWLTILVRICSLSAGSILLDVIVDRLSRDSRT